MVHHSLCVFAGGKKQDFKGSQQTKELLSPCLSTPGPGFALCADPQGLRAHSASSPNPDAEIKHLSPLLGAARMEREGYTSRPQVWVRSSEIFKKLLLTAQLWSFKNSLGKV